MLQGPSSLQQGRPQAGLENVYGSYGQQQYDIRGVRKLSHEELTAQRLSVEQAQSLRRHPITLVLEDIRSLYNVGSIFRSADAFRIERLVLTGFTPHPPRKEITKTALGAEASVPWVYEPDTITAINRLRTEGMHVFAIELAQQAITLSDMSTRLLNSPGEHYAFVLGNELTGVSDSVMGLCEGAVEIPMYGTKHSLNVAVAAGIVMQALVSGFVASHHNDSSNSR